MSSLRCYDIEVYIFHLVHAFNESQISFSIQFNSDFTYALRYKAAVVHKNEVENWK